MSATSTHPIRISLEKSVLGVEVFDLLSNMVIKTFHRPGSRCSFAVEEIGHGSFLICFRLDWGQSEQGEPVLDMDVKRRLADGTFKPVRPKKNPAHHTSVSTPLPRSNQPRFYDVEFEGLHLRLVARKNFASAVGLSVYVVDSTASQHTERSDG
jgi:hypothetical protein